jgi:hypothetical protein
MTIEPAPIITLTDPGVRVSHYASDAVGSAPEVVWRVRRFWGHFGSWITERYSLRRGDWS